jgi:hypothetical protein
MSGGYCCFGVFTLYNDRTLIDVLSVVLKLAIDIPLKDIMVEYLYFSSNIMLGISKIAKSVF